MTPDSQLRAAVAALRDKYDEAATALRLNSLVNNGKRAVYLRVRDDLAALLDAPEQSAEREGHRPDCTIIQNGECHCEETVYVHWTSDAPTSLHGNGAGSFERTTRKVAEVTCKLCLSLLQKVSEYPCETCGGPVLEQSVVCLRDNERDALHAPSAETVTSEEVEALARVIYEAASDAADAPWDDLKTIGAEALYLEQARAVLAAGYRREVSR